MITLSQGVRKPRPRWAALLAALAAVPLLGGLGCHGRDATAAGETSAGSPTRAAPGQPDVGAQVVGSGPNGSGAVLIPRSSYHGPLSAQGPSGGAPTGGGPQATQPSGPQAIGYRSDGTAAATIPRSSYHGPLTSAH